MGKGITGRETRAAFQPSGSRSNRTQLTVFRPASGYRTHAEGIGIIDHATPFSFAAQGWEVARLGLLAMMTP